MKLTGKCKEDFDKHIETLKDFDRFRGDNERCDFDNLPSSMRYGVYVDFFESVNIYFSKTIVLNGSTIYIDNYDGILIIRVLHSTVGTNEMRIAVIEKANEIYNSNNYR